MAEVTDEALVSRVERAVAERLFDETVILDPVADRYVRLNRTGTSLWEALERPSTVGELAARLEREFGIDAECARADVAAFVDRLAERDLIYLGG